MKETPTDRLNKVLKDLIYAEKVGTKLAFAELLGYDVSYVSQLLNGKREITERISKRIFEKTGVLPMWLLTGRGEMYEATCQQLNEPQSQYTETKSEEDSQDITPRLSSQKEVIALGKHKPLRLKPEEYGEAFGDWAGLPIYNSPITASFIATYRDETLMQPYYYLHDPRFKDCDFGAIITGDSMYPEIRHGDIVICKEIQDKSFIVYGDIYYITAKNGLETCKYVNGHDTDENKLMLVPRNDSIKPSPINKDMVMKLYKLRGLIRGY